jgi:hypothetical protein
MQNNAKQRNLAKMTAISRRFTKTHASSSKFLQDRGIAFSEAEAIVRTGLTSPDTLLLPFWLFRCQWQLGGSLTIGRTS